MLKAKRMFLPSHAIAEGGLPKENQQANKQQQASDELKFGGVWYRKACGWKPRRRLATPREMIDVHEGG